MTKTYSSSEDGSPSNDGQGLSTKSPISRPRTLRGSVLEKLDYLYNLVNSVSDEASAIRVGREIKFYQQGVGNYNHIYCVPYVTAVREVKE